MISAAPIIPEYEEVARRFATPMRHGDGLRFRTNPAALGRSEAPVVFANVMQLYGHYYITGPTFPANSERLMRTAVEAGKAAIEAHNNRQPGGQKIYTATSETGALTLLWGLLTAHYGIKDAPTQVQQFELREATDRRQAEEDSQAALELAQLGTSLEAAQREVEKCEARLDSDRRYFRSKTNEAMVAFGNDQTKRAEYCAPAKQAVGQAILLLAAAEQQLDALLGDQSPATAAPVVTPSADWIADYPQADEEESVAKYDLENEHPVHNWLRWSYAVNDDETLPGETYTEWVDQQIKAEVSQDEVSQDIPADDVNQDYPGEDDYGSQDNLESEAIGDLYSSQWD